MPEVGSKPGAGPADHMKISVLLALFLLVACDRKSESYGFSYKRIVQSDPGRVVHSFAELGSTFELIAPSDLQMSMSNTTGRGLSLVLHDPKDVESRIRLAIKVVGQSAVVEEAEGKCKDLNLEKDFNGRWELE